MTSEPTSAYGIIYKTTCIPTGKIYVGQTVRNINNSNYIGSGKLILKAIKKYSLSAFEKEILEECYSQEELDEKEML